jgi:hypothetical protein
MVAQGSTGSLKANNEGNFEDRPSNCYRRAVYFGRHARGQGPGPAQNIKVSVFAKEMTNSKKCSFFKFCGFFVY